MTCPTADAFALAKDTAAETRLVRNWLDDIATVEIDDRASLFEIGRMMHRGEIPVLICHVEHPASRVLKQAFSVWTYEYKQETPAKLWSQSRVMHPSVYRSLQIDKDEVGARYAALPFRPAKVDDEWRILAAFPPERFLSGQASHWTHLDIEAVVSWHPPSGKFEVLGDPAPQLLLPRDLDFEKEGKVYGDFFAFARNWAERRAAFWQLRQDHLANKWVHPIVEPRDGNIPGILAIGDPAKIRWPLSDLPELLTCIGIDRNAVNSAIFKQTKLPRVVEQKMRVTA